MIGSLFLKAFIGSIARHAITAGGVTAVSTGAVDADQFQQFMGAIATAGGIAWAAYEKWKKLP